MAGKPNPVQTGAPKPKSRQYTSYKIIWGTLAGISLVYLALLLTEPTLVASYLGTGSSQTAEANESRRAAADAVAEVRLLRESVDRFRDDLQELKAQAATQSERDRDVTARLAALETPPVPEPKQTAAEKRAAAKAAKTATAEATASPTIVATAMNVPAAKAVASAKKTEALETGSVAAPAAGAVSFGPPVVTPAARTPAAPSKLLGVQIATGPSVDSLRLSWTLLSERHGEALTSLQPRYTTGTDGSGTTYDLVVGPINSAADAKRLCEELAAKATPCAISIYSGDVL